MECDKDNAKLYKDEWPIWKNFMCEDKGCGILNYKQWSLPNYKEHYKNDNDITFSLKPMKNFNRYGFVKTDLNGEVLSLEEKKYRVEGEIDGGIYLIKKTIFSEYENNKKFSFNDFIVTNLKNLKVGSLLCDKLFIDIGTPEDYGKAHKVLGNQL